MKDYFAGGRRIGIGLTAAMILSMAGIYYWDTRPSSSHGDAMTQTEATCVQHIAPTAMAELDTEMQRQMADNKANIAAGMRNGWSQPTYDSAKAQSDYSASLREIDRNTAYCSAYAKCFPTKPFKKMFDACYAVMADKSDRASDSVRE